MINILPQPVEGTDFDAKAADGAASYMLICLHVRRALFGIKNSITAAAGQIFRPLYCTGRAGIFTLCAGSAA